MRSVYFKITATAKLQELAYANSRSYGYGENNLKSGRHSYSFGLSYIL